MKRTRLFSMSLLAVSALTLAACGDTSNEGDSPVEATPAASASQSAEGTAVADGGNTAAITLEDGVIRATVEDNPMTSVFGELHNDSDEEITITGFTADVEAGSYEIHEIVDGVMQEKIGGITIPAGEDHDLDPGGDHFMLMDLQSPIAAGDVVKVTLELADGSTVDLGEVPVRTIAAGDEDYGDLDGHDMDDMDGHDMDTEGDVDGMEHEH